MHPKSDDHTLAPLIVLQIMEQNAGVLVSRNVARACFEMFELSPTNEAAMTTKGRLVRSFPTTAVEVALSDFKSDAFQTTIAKTLAKMSQQSLRETKRRQTESQENQEVLDDTVDPMIVTELFASMLRGCGKALPPLGICKNTRDDITEHWSRSPLWLLIRVALQLSMTRHSSDADNTYKEFMAFLMARALHMANQQKKISSEILDIMLTKVSRRLSKLHSLPVELG